MTTWYVCMYEHSWGRGTTIDEAKRNARAAGGKGNKWIIRRLPEGVVEPYVNGLGTICWVWADSHVPEDPADAPTSVVVACGRGVPPQIKAEVVD